MLCYGLSRTALLCSATLCYALLRSSSPYALLCSAMPRYGLSLTALLCSDPLCCALLRSSSLYALLYATMLCYALLCSATLCYALLCSALLWYAMLCYALLRYMICYALLRSVTHCFALLIYALVYSAMLFFAICSAMRCYGLLAQPGSAGSDRLSSALLCSLVCSALLIFVLMTAMRMPNTQLSNLLNEMCRRESWWRRCRLQWRRRWRPRCNANRCTAIHTNGRPVAIIGLSNVEQSFRFLAIFRIALSRPHLCCFSLSPYHDTITVFASLLMVPYNSTPPLL